MDPPTINQDSAQVILLTACYDDDAPSMNRTGWKEESRSRPAEDAAHYCRRPRMVGPTIDIIPT